MINVLKILKVLSVFYTECILAMLMFEKKVYASVIAKTLAIPFTRSTWHRSAIATVGGNGQLLAKTGKSCHTSHS